MRITPLEEGVCAQSRLVLRGRSYRRMIHRLRDAVIRNPVKLRDESMSSAMGINGRPYPC